MERALARLFRKQPCSWLLKGGLATELRHQPHARTTRDLDLSIPDGEVTAAKGHQDLHAQLLEIFQTDIDDYFTFELSTTVRELQGVPQGGSGFLCECRLAGRAFARFHLDVGIGDILTSFPEKLNGNQLVSFADIPSVTVDAVPLVQQFAEKLHAYTCHVRAVLTPESRTWSI
jgi:hypothetical protein